MCRRSSSTPINPATLTSSNILVETLQGGQGTPVNATFTLDPNDPTGKTVQISIGQCPVCAWTPDTIYQIQLNTGFRILFGYSLSQAYSMLFVTAPDMTQSSPVVSPLDTSPPSMSVQVTPGAIPPGRFVIDRVKFLSPASPVTAAAAALSNAASASNTLQILKTTEVLIYRSLRTGGPGLPAPDQSDAPLTLSFAAPTNLATLNLNPASLGIYTLGSSVLVPVPNTTLNPDGSLSAPITQSGVYFLAAALPH